MRTKVFFFSLLMGLVMVGNAFAEDENPIKKPIVLTPEKGYGDERGVVIIPLEAYYQGETIFLDFTHNVGDVEVSVRNTTIGNNWSGTVDSADGMGQISIANGGAGSYSVEIVTEYGECFTGSFNL